MWNVSLRKPSSPAALLPVSSDKKQDTEMMRNLRFSTFSLLCISLASLLLVQLYYSTSWSSAEPDKSQVIEDYGYTVYDVIPGNRARYNAAKELVDSMDGFEYEFEGVDNNTGVERLIVPNIVHYLRAGRKCFTFIDYICMRSAYLRQKPDYIFIHSDVVGEFRGKYWSWILAEPDLASRLIVVGVKLPKRIFGQAMNPEFFDAHGADVAILNLMSKFGGIFLHNDVYVVQNLNSYRKFEMVVALPKNERLTNKVIVAHQRARFQRQWLGNYHDYNYADLNFNLLDNPTMLLHTEFAEQVHKEESRLGIQGMTIKMYEMQDWKVLVNQYDTFHMLADESQYRGAGFFDEEYVLGYKSTLAEIARVALINRPPAILQGDVKYKSC